MYNSCVTRTEGETGDDWAGATILEKLLERGGGKLLFYIWPKWGGNLSPRSQQELALAELKQRRSVCRERAWKRTPVLQWVISSLGHSKRLSTNCHGKIQAWLILTLLTGEIVNHRVWFEVQGLLPSSLANSVCNPRIRTSIISSCCPIASP